jgi:hypothetical protein
MRTVIQINEVFAILRTESGCAYGSFETREEAEQALAEASASDKAHAYDPANY